MYELQLATTGDSANAISELLLDLGALAITLADAQDNPIFEPTPESLPLWPTIKLTALFDDTFALEPLMLQLYAHFDPTAIKEVKLVEIADQDWIHQTQLQTQPLLFGKNLWIYPSWHDEPNAPGVKILLDPGLAFGTGTHPTTSLMLTWLDQHPPKDLTVLDYGCGSGILALGAAKLDAKQVWCTDIDPQALMATRDNAQRNHLSEKEILTCLPEDLPADLKVEVILANILAEPLLNLAPRFAEYLLPNGLVALSGILATQIAGISEVYEKYFSLEDIYYQDEWAAMAWRLR